MKISVVIPTYNRLTQLAEALDHLLASDVEGFEDVEIIVVDDGSRESSEKAVAAKTVSPPIRLRCLYQTNAGPAAARNNGLRSAANDIVLFIDDDVLVSRALLRQHFQGHIDRPGSVIFGLYPYVKPEQETPSYRYLDAIEREARIEVAADKSGYVEARIVASGNLSVEKAQFPDGVYDETLKTPMSEEIELAIRLWRSKIPIYYVPAIEALHTQPTTIDGKCIQDYKYGYGIAEAYARLAYVAPPEQFSYTMQVNGPIISDDAIKLKLAKSVKSVLGSKPGRSIFLSVVRLAERLMPNNDMLLFSLYRKVVGVHYFAGIRDGLARFCNIDVRSGENE
ncbi:MAG: glycosyltransferase family A protein [Pyrinomonadaceae bacterium]